MSPIKYTLRHQSENSEKQLPFHLFRSSASLTSFLSARNSFLVYHVGVFHLLRFWRGKGESSPAETLMVGAGGEQARRSPRASVLFLIAPSSVSKNTLADLSLMFLNCNVSPSLGEDANSSRHVCRAFPLVDGYHLNIYLCFCFTCRCVFIGWTLSVEIMRAETPQSSCVAKDPDVTYSESVSLVSVAGAPRWRRRARDGGADSSHLLVMQWITRLSDKHQFDYDAQR